MKHAIGHSFRAKRSDSLGEAPLGVDAVEVANTRNPTVDDVLRCGGNAELQSALAGNGAELGVALAGDLALAVAGVAVESSLSSNQAMARVLRRAQEGRRTVASSLGALAHSAGHALPPQHLGRFAAAFSHDFSHVRIHTDGRSAAAAETLNAHAFALGADIFFGAGEYAPGTPDGDRLLAHELTHVVQHDQGRIAATGEVSQPTDPLEREAYATESRITAMLDAQSPARSTANAGAVRGDGTEAPASGMDAIARLVEASRGPALPAVIAERLGSALGSDVYFGDGPSGSATTILRSEDADSAAGDECGPKGGKETRHSIGVYPPEVHLLPGCAELKLGERLTVLLEATAAPETCEVETCEVRTEFAWQAPHALGSPTALSTEGTIERGARAEVAVTAQEVGHHEMVADLEIKTYFNFEDGTVDSRLTSMRTDPAPVTVPEVKLSVDAAKQGDVRIPEVERLLVGDTLLLTWTVEPAVPEGLSRVPESFATLGGDGRLVPLGEAITKENITEQLTALEPGKFTIERTWQLGATTATPARFEGLVQEEADNLCNPDRTDAPCVIPVPGSLNSLAPETMLPDDKARLDRGRVVLMSLETEAKTLAAVAPLLATKAFVHSPPWRQKNANASALLTKLAMTIAAEAATLRADNGSSVLASDSEAYVGRIVAAFSPIATGISTLDGTNGTTGRFCSDLPGRLDALRGALLAYFPMMKHAESATAPELRDWAESLGELASESESAPWFMYIPLLNLAGLPAYDPFTDGLGYTSDTMAQTLAEHSAEIFGPIPIAVLSAWQIMLEPHKIVEITEGKIDLIRKLADPSLSPSEKWTLIANFGGDRVIDIAFTKIPGLKAGPTPTGGGLAEWRRWAFDNKNFFAQEILKVMLKDGLKGTKKELLGLGSTDEIWAKIPQSVLVAVIEKCLPQVVPDDVVKAWLQKQTMREVATELAKALLGT